MDFWTLSRERTPLAMDEARQAAFLDFVRADEDAADVLTLLHNSVVAFVETTNVLRTSAARLGGLCCDTGASLRCTHGSPIESCVRCINDGHLHLALRCVHHTEEDAVVTVRATGSATRGGGALEVERVVHSDVLYRRFSVDPRALVSDEVLAKGLLPVSAAFHNGAGMSLLWDDWSSAVEENTVLSRMRAHMRVASPGKWI